MVIENTKKNFYGITPFCSAGQSLWVWAIASNGVDENTIIGDYIEFTPDLKKKKQGYSLT